MTDHITGPYTHADEIAFMHGLLEAKKYERAINYCRLIVRNNRRWDSTVNVAEVRLCAEQCLRIARAAMNGVAK